MAKAKVVFPDGKELLIDAAPEDLARLSVTPGYLVRVSGDAQLSSPLAFVGVDEDGFRRVGPQRGTSAKPADDDLIQKVTQKA